MRLPFLVDDYFVPNGCFGDADCQGEVIGIDGRACPSSERPATFQSVCRKYTYSPLSPEAPGYKGHLGILFQGAPPDGDETIGKVAGLTVAPGARRVSFWAKVGAATASVLFRAGGANNWEGQTNAELPYRDDFAVSELVTLDTTSQELSLDLSQVSYSQVVSPFGWAIESMGSDPIELYIDDVRWE